MIEPAMLAHARAEVRDWKRYHESMKTERNRFKRERDDLLSVIFASHETRAHLVACLTSQDDKKSSSELRPEKA